MCPDDFTPLQADITLSDTPGDPLIGRVFDSKYELIERLGGGGMGTVYRAKHLLIDRTVAIKVLSQRFVGDETAQQRFRREARAAGRVQHPNAVAVSDFGATPDGYLFLVMEMLEGRTLRELMAREGPLDAARAVSIMLQVCGAVAAGHEVQLIHRDLKPANIFIEHRPNLPAIVKVLDFGVAKFVVEDQDEDYQTLTQVGVIIGTPRYMSPEQCSGTGTLTPASDVYSLGIILYEMLTGVVPFVAETSLALALKQLTEVPHPPREIVASIPEKLEKVVLHALTKNPADRPANAEELRRELHEVAEELGLEHAESTVSPTMEALRQVGTESPSGRLVIDIATLRQIQASTAAQSDGGAGKVRSTATLSNQTAETNPTRPEFDRLQVPLAKESPGAVSPRARIAVVAMIALIAILALVSLSSGWWGSQTLVTPYQTTNNNVQPQPDASVTPTPSPTPSPDQTREAKGAPKKGEKGPGFFGKVKRRFKKIF